MAIVLDKTGGPGSRPMLQVAGDGLAGEPDEYWTPKLEAAADRVARAIRAVARIDTPGGFTHFVGSAFMVAPRLAVTTDYVGQQLFVRGHQQLEPGQPLALLNFGVPPDDGLQIPVVRVEPIHPHWKSAFLVLGEAVPEDRILPLSGKGDFTGDEPREIFVVGYPALDVRNDTHLQERLTGGLYEVKRVMPGMMTGWEDFNGDAMLAYDASTLGGTGGGPVVDLEEGRVLGVSFAGHFLKANYAAPAWELSRDPQYSRLWDHEIAPPAGTPAGAAQQALAIDEPKKRNAIFAHPRILALTGLLVDNGFDDVEDIGLLLLGLPPEMLATLPQPNDALGRLAGCLAALNRMTFAVGDHVPIYYVLINAANRLRWNPDFVKAIDPYKSEAEAVLAGAQEERNLE
jgi:hypothetical protein